MSTMNIYDSLLTSGSSFFDQAAVIDQDGELSYAQLHTSAQELRNCLPDMAGLPIGLAISNGRYFIVGLLALLSAGAVAVPLPVEQLGNTFSPGVDLAGMLTHSSAPSVSAIVGGFHFEPREAFSSSAQALHNLVDSPAVIRPTSGTTGQSKGVVLSHHSVLARMTASAEALRLTPKDRVCWVLPMSQHFIASVLAYLHTGCAIICASGQHAETMIEAIDTFRATLFYAAPIHYTLLARSLSSASLRSLRLALSTTAPLDPEVATEFHSRFNIRPRQVLGIIELGLPLGALDHEEPYASRTVGRPLPGFEFRLREEKQGIGELLLKGPGMFDAYLSPPLKRSDVLIDGWFATGDLARLDANGNIQICGRKKSVIITAGQKVFPEEVEAVLSRYPGVRLARVRSERHSLLGEIVVADVAVEEGVTLEEESAISFCKKHLSRFKVPQRIFLRSEIPLTSTGKISRA
ncbi:MAG: AMP-binding protein [Bdellovibrionota bacterium]